MGKHVPRAASAKQLKGPLVFLDPDDAVLVEDPEAALYDDRVARPVDEHLVASLRAFGVIVPAIGRRNGDKVEIADGRARVRALREANRINRSCGQPVLRLPVVLRDASDPEAAAVAVSANELRWGDSPLAKAKKVQRLVRLGYQQKEVARIFGASKTSVSIWLSLLRLTPELQARLERGDLLWVDAVRLARLPREEQTLAEPAGEDGATAEDELQDGPRAKHERVFVEGRANGAGAGAPGPRESPPAPAAPEPIAEPAAHAHNGRPPATDRDTSSHRSRLRDLAVYVTEVDREALEPAWSMLLLWLVGDDDTTPELVTGVLPRLAPFFEWRRGRGEP